MPRTKHPMADAAKGRRRSVSRRRQSTAIPVFAHSKFEMPIPSLFDTNKLNFRYSFERLRGKGYHKKKPAFYKVLKKYYRMHTAVTVFNEPVTRKGRKMSILQQIINQKTAERILPKRKPKMQIGKLRKFSFQDQELQRAPFEESPEFKHIDIEKFRESFLKALDDFVVRKELVISSHGSTVSTTITFTKKSIFLKFQD
ncbi:hypothetical protein KUTeg_004299 [Tegillarca granosa]|uniref:Uncharacterized protein n=1 Tax=Tegillarca granosa TaxID=220873 RepID=A0ABQ9FPM5_TEGGR|nr:hypothetical protein KUTeg_004299 [Tegillarca granosa]